MSRGLGSSSSQHAHSSSFASSSAQSARGSTDHAETPSEASSMTTEDSAANFSASPRTPPLDVEGNDNGHKATDLTEKYRAAFGTPPQTVSAVEIPEELPRAVTPVAQDLPADKREAPFTPPSKTARSSRALYGPSTPAARSRKTSGPKPSGTQTRAQEQPVALPRRGSPQKVAETVPPVPTVFDAPPPPLPLKAKTTAVKASSAKLLAATSVAPVANASTNAPKTRKTISPPAKPLTSLVSWTPEPAAVPPAVLSVIKGPTPPEPRIQSQKPDRPFVMPAAQPKELLSRSRTLASTDTRATPVFRRDLEKALHE